MGGVVDRDLELGARELASRCSEAFPRDEIKARISPTGSASPKSQPIHFLRFFCGSTEILQGSKDSLRFEICSSQFLKIQTTQIPDIRVWEESSSCFIPKSSVSKASKVHSHRQGPGRFKAGLSHIGNDGIFNALKFVAFAKVSQVKIRPDPCLSKGCRTGVRHHTGEIHEKHDAPTKNANPDPCLVGPWSFSVYTVPRLGCSHDVIE